MKRREFILTTAGGLGAAWMTQHWLTRQSILNVLADTRLPQKYAASDTVTLGKTGIKTSRLAMGTGTVGYAKHSNQTALGIGGLSALLLNGYDHGLRFFDTADSYGSHPARCGCAETASARQSNGDDQKPVAHAAGDARRPRPLPPGAGNRLHRHCADALCHRRRLDGALQRDDGCALRSQGKRHHPRPRLLLPHIEALRAAAKSPWVEVDLVRINPIGSHMDDDPATVVSVIRQMKASGKGIVGMKVLGQGDLRTRQSEAIKYALSLNLLDAFTIGAESKSEQDNLIQRVAAA